MKKRIAVGFLKYGLGFGLLAYVVWRNWAPPGSKGLSDIWREHVVEGKPINGTWFLAGLVICLAAVLSTFVRWYYLVRALKLPFGMGDAVRLGLVGYYFNNFLPSSIGGDVIKAALVAREHRERRAAGVASVLVDRIVGLWGLFWLVMLTGLAFWAVGWLEGEHAPQLKFIVKSATGVVLVSSVVWCLVMLLPPTRAERFAGRLSRIPKAGHVFAQLWRASYLYRFEGSAIALALVIAILGHVGFVAAFYCSALTVFSPDVVPPLKDHFLIVPIGMVAQASIPVPGGLGVGEACFGKLYEWVGAAKENGVTASFVQRVVQWILGFGGYVVYLWMKPDIQRAEAEMEEEEATADGGPEVHAGSEEDRGHRSLIPDSEKTAP